MSWEPPVEECPVNITGSGPSRVMPKRTAVHPHVSTARQPTRTTTATSVVSAQVVAGSMRGRRSRTVAGSSSWSTGRPSASAMLSGTMSRAAAVQPAAVQDAARKARYPATSR
jgi:hypothetical protein